MRRINLNPRQILLAYYDVHIHPQSPKNPAYQILRDLIAAKATGTDVRFLFPPFKRNPANRRAACYLNTAGIRVRVMPDHQPLHCKMTIFDRDCVILGSHNLSRPALAKNIETSAILTDPADIDAARDDFYCWWRVARQIREEH